MARIWKGDKPLPELLWSCFLTHLRPRVFIVPTLSPLAAPHVAIKSTRGTASDDKVYDNFRFLVQLYTFKGYGHNYALEPPNCYQAQRQVNFDIKAYYFDDNFRED